MKSLSRGRIFFILLISLNLYANAHLELDTPAIYKGDIATFTITADGKKVEFPKISNINGYQIIGTSDSQSINMINGNVKETVSRSYSFIPDSNVTIPEFEVRVDSRIYTTKKAIISVLEPDISDDKALFIVEMKTLKDSVMVGDSVKLDVVFKVKLSAKFDRFEYENPNLNDFFVKPIGNMQKTSEGEYLVHTLSYLLFPQKVGVYKIEPINAYFGKNSISNDPFFGGFFSNMDVEWKKVSSNSLNLEVLPLPNGVKNVGNFEINITSDKTTVNANEPVNLTLSIKGVGNVDDISKFNLNLPNAVVYTDDPKTTQTMINNEFGGEFTQKFAIVGDRNFTVPSFEFKYFDKDLNDTKAIKTDELKIEVINKTPQILPKVETINENLLPKTEQTKQTKQVNSYLNFFVGFVAGIFASYLIFLFKNKRKSPKKEINIVVKIKKSKSDKELFETLLPYAKSSDFIDENLLNLEKNIYKNDSNIIDKKALIAYFEELNEEFKDDL